MIETCSISSGSKGNSFFFKSDSCQFLIDCGVSCRQICLRLESAGFCADDIQGVFITHEHSDHIAGLRVFIKKYKVPVYITEKTYRKSGLEIPDDLLKIIKCDDKFRIRDLTVEVLPKKHDAADPCIFNFYENDKKVSFITDTGSVSESVVNSVRGADIIFIETNYDDEMLKNCDYAQALKKRIDSQYGHLSNTQAGFAISRLGSANLKYVFLSHISENSNTPARALETVRNILKLEAAGINPELILTSRFECSKKVVLP